LARVFVVSAEIVPRPFVVLAEIVAVGVRPPSRLEVLPCERTTAWDEHFKARQKYIEALDASYEAERLVIRNVRLAALACDNTADYASETAHHARRLLARAVVANPGIKELCEV